MWQLLILTTAALHLLSSHGASQTPAVKRDILGFSPGMTAEELSARRAKWLIERRSQPGCAKPIDERKFLGFSMNDEKQCGVMAASFTTELKQNLVKDVQLQFYSGTAPADMILQITEQFQAKPIKSDWQTEINKATTLSTCTIFGKTQFCVGGFIAKGALDRDNLTLDLTLNRPAAGANPNEYFLTLSSAAVARLDTEAAQKRRNEQELQRRTINPNQRF